MSYFETDNNMILWRDLIHEISPHMAGGREHPANANDIALKLLEDGSDEAVRFTIAADPDGDQAFINDAPGMNAEKFDWFMRKLSAQDPDKPNGGSMNYGIGVRTASLRASPGGVSVWTKKDGVTLYGRFAKQGGGYGPDAQFDGEVFIEVDDLPDWVSGVMDGALDHGTVTVHEGNGKGDATAKTVTSVGTPAWAMSRRWWKVAPNLKVSASNDLAPSNNGSNFIPLSDCVRARKGTGMVAKDEWEAVSLEGGIKLHFAFMSKKGSQDKRQIGWANYRKSFGGIVYRNEVYEFGEGSAWVQQIERMGLSAISDKTCVFVELPDDYPVRIAKLRTHLLFKEGAGHGEDGEHVRMRSFASTVRSNLPGWVVKAVKAALSQRTAKSTLEAQKRMADLFKQMKLLKDGVATHLEGDDPANDDRGGTLADEPYGKKHRKNPGPGARSSKKHDPDGALKGKLGKGALPPFNVRMADTKDLVNGHGRFFIWLVPSTDFGHDVWWNCFSTLHKDIRKQSVALAHDYDLSKEALDAIVRDAIGGAVSSVFGPAYVQMHYNGTHGGWSEEDLEEVQKPACLSLALGNQIDFSALVALNVKKAIADLPVAASAAA